MKTTEVASSMERRRLGVHNMASYEVSALPKPTLPGANQTPPVQEKHRPHNA